MSGRTLLAIILVPVAIIVPVILVKLAVSDVDPMVPVELLRPYEVVTAEYYGVRLDEKATPSEVVYVLLRSIKDTFIAGRAPTRQEQSEGVRRCREIQLAVAGPQSILDGIEKQGIPIKDRQATVAQKLILRTVLAWSRLLGFYVDSVDLSSVEAANRWMRVNISEGTSDRPASATVAFAAKKDQFEASVLIRLAKECDRWRITRALLGPGAPSLTKTKLVTKSVVSQPAATRPAPTPVTKPAAPPKQPKPAAAAPASKPATTQKPK